MSRRILKVFFLLCAISFSFAVQAASASDISAIDINVQLNDDGSARIVQEWEVNVYGKGSELYIPQTRLGDMEIKDFSVSDNSGNNYINEGMGWNSKRSVQEKAGRCGIAKTNKGFELCWGLGSDGKRTFRVSWTFTNFIKSYDDYDGFIVRLVNDKMSPAPERVRITLEKPGRPFAVGEVDMWAFGFKGKIIPEDGKILVTSEHSLSKNNHVTVMLRFARGIFKPLSKVSGSFKAVEDRAMEGAYYEKTWGDYLEILIALAMAVIIGLAILAIFIKFVIGLIRCIWNYSKYGDVISISCPKVYSNLDSNTKKQLWKAPWVRDIPFDGDLSAACWVIKNTPMSTVVKKSSFVEAYFLRFLKLGLMAVKDSSANQIELAIIEGAPAFSILNECEAELFEILKDAAGKNGVLERCELKAWGELDKNKSRMLAWLNKTDAAGKDVFNKKNGHVYEIKRGRLFGKTTILNLTEAGKKMLFDTYGFRNYLLDFTLINERRAVEVELWEDYLVFASLFNIAKQVRKELAALNASFVKTSVLMSSDSTFEYVSTFANTLSSSANASSSVSGGWYNSSSGGSSFRGGGGGHSGGGSGGGVR